MMAALTVGIDSQDTSAFGASTVVKLSGGCEKLGFVAGVTADLFSDGCNRYACMRFRVAASYCYVLEIRGLK